MSALRSKARGWMLGWRRPRGVAPKRMPKADATGLAPKKSATNPLETPEGFRLADSRAAGGRRPPHLTACPFRRQRYRPTAVGSQPLYFFGGVSERRPWASKRDRPPGRFCPALLIAFVVAQSRTSRVLVRLIWAAFQSGMPPLRCALPSCPFRHASLC